MKKTGSTYKINRNLFFEITVSIISAIILRHIGDPEFVWTEILTSNYIIRLISIVIDVLVLWETVKYLTKYFNVWLSWDSDIKKRLIVQYGLITLISLVAVSISEYFFRYLIEHDHLDIYYLTLHLPILTIISFLISFYYTIIFFLNNQTAKTEKIEFISTISDTKGFSTFNIEINNVAYFYYSNRLVFVVTKKGDVGSINFSLDNLSKKVNPVEFIKVNRQFILSKKSIERYNEIENRKLEVFVLPAILEDIKIIISSKKSTLFKKWLKEI